MYGKYCAQRLLVELPSDLGLPINVSWSHEILLVPGAGKKVRTNSGLKLQPGLNLVERSDVGSLAIHTRASSLVYVRSVGKREKYEIASIVRRFYPLENCQVTHIESRVQISLLVVSTLKLLLNYQYIYYILDPAHPLRFHAADRVGNRITRTSHIIKVTDTVMQGCAQLLVKNQEFMSARISGKVPVSLHSALHSPVKAIEFSDPGENEFNSMTSCMLHASSLQHAMSRYLDIPDCAMNTSFSPLKAEAYICVMLAL
ncbi:hypothetical protein C8Q75DRAFT_732899 [Abortiporus biennis]|nr:hypothetical protein C8Q75DRAFT_732899 [Abortiporus biennis]